MSRSIPHGSIRYSIIGRNTMRMLWRAASEMH